MTPLISIVAGAATDTGLRRRINEDAHLARSPLFLVADGMGGHDAGELASAAVVAEFSLLSGRESVSIDDVHAALGRARTRVEALPPGRGAGAGTTLTGVVVTEVGAAAYWLALNVGDSRTYLLSEGVFEQVSVDHSLVQELLDSGELDAATARADTRRNVITRAIGGGERSEPDFWLLPAMRGDRVLVCSDGLSGEVPAERIEEILRADADPQTAATRLVHEALLRGGRDNVTVLVVDAIDVRAGGEPDVQATQPSAAQAIDGDTLPRVATAGGRA